MISPRNGMRAGNRTISVTANAIAGAAAHQPGRDEAATITLPSAGAVYAYQAGRLIRDGEPQPVRAR